MDARVKPELLTTILDWTERSGVDRPSRAAEETTRLFDEFRRPVLRYLSSFGLAAPDCDEILQETFISLFLHLRREGSEANLAGWIFRVAHNQAIKCRNRQNRERLAGLQVVNAEVSAAPEADLERRLLEGERHQRLRSVVAALSAEERQCLFLRAEGLRYREIADVLGISIAGVSNLLARALDRLRRADETQGRR